ncbi:Membrane protein involved in the export of O-antigen and teichoic acid [Balnearium lithotrophicum]|uniref:Membrane protein involved in the export of O-antigen and teichoic acid n=1 Tax=Balnearium lithotrophicum TaxID=223788 RepID=A0A521C871_9BACT|nr:flippase [Balnearium lithotrophicum]SMO55594.1 Membrane protein involved in the export of O-antigen and teichoic acid [Balnearium lithotrophicum]
MGDRKIKIKMFNKIGLLRDKINSDEHFKEILKGSSIAFILRIVGIVAGYIFTLLITRGYGAEAMGAFALSFTLLQISSVIGRLGMDTALLRFVAEYSSQGKWEVVKDVYKKAIKLVFPFSLILSVTVFFFSGYIAEIVFKKPHLERYFKIASIGIVPFVLLFIHTESLRGLKKIKEYMLLQQAGIFILASSLLACITLLVKQLTIRQINQIPIFIYILSEFVISLMAFFLWKKQLTNSYPSISQYTKEQIKRPINETLSYATILSVSIPMLFSSSLALIMGWTDTIMLGIFKTEREVGIYNVVLRVSMITSITLMAINTIAAPKFAEFWGKGDVKGLAKVAQQSTKLIFWTSFPILSIFLVFPKLILRIFGEDFKAGTTALIILTLGQFVNAVTGSVGYILRMTGYQKFHQNVILIGAILNIILNYLLIPMYSIIGAAIASSISVVFWNFIFSIKIKNILGNWILYVPFKR